MSEIGDTAYHLYFHRVAHCISIFMGWNVSVFTYNCTYVNPSLHAQSVCLVIVELPLSTLTHARTDCMSAYINQLYTVCA